MTPVSWLPIRYRDFYDIPRAIVVDRRGETYFFDCPFVDERDDYAEDFTVYRLPRSLANNLDSISWEHLSEQGEIVGTVPVIALQLDPSKRSAISEDVFDRLGV